MKLDEFLEKVAAGGPVPLSAEEWEALSPSFPEVERYNTQLAGDLIIAQVGEKLGGFRM